MRVVILDENGQERDRLLCRVPRDAVNHRVSLGVKAGRIEVRLDEKRPFRMDARGAGGLGKNADFEMNPLRPYNLSEDLLQIKVCPGFIHCDAGDCDCPG